ncbi:MAG: hypothetical protein AAF411_03565 [Myxococcota bacterium]
MMGQAENPWSTLHDATLLKVIVDWKGGDATLVFAVGSAADVVKVVANAFVALEVPRYEPWGPSVSVNRISGPLVTQDDRHRIELEMQSGDVLALEASRIRLRGA